MPALSDHQDMIDELLGVESGLSAWEMDFIENIDGRESASQNQADKIDQIWNRVLG